MLRLSPHSSCDTFVDLRLKSPLLHAYEFMGIARERSSEFEIISSFAANRHWHFQLDKLKTFLKQPTNAVVVTCKSQKIEWVNKGFTRMTGYSADEALGRTPKFLQGKETSVSVRKMIRESLEQEKKFSGQVMNYRKTGELYVCDVEILPIYNDYDELVNFMALEREAV
jgi:PAS domain S-box-containing protein